MLQLEYAIQNESVMGGLDKNTFEEKALQGSGALVSENMFAVDCAIVVCYFIHILPLL